ncbi:class I SAM-dependent methyltransferase [Halobaculum sp. EA56]|uniref:class I SAM-dependent methyltransferase n=1 Tax=Halobaculum sp. EA56 TaxID=3421648 RepID=UPI003EBB9EE6
MRGLLTAALENPWGALGTVLGGPLHPGGREATADLLDRAGVGEGTRLLDVGCGAGTALAQARDRGATAAGIDRSPDRVPGTATVRGDLAALPVADGAVDVALAECVLCLADDLDGALADVARTLAPEGRLALSDVVVDGDLPALPGVIERTLCLDGDRRRERLVDAVEDAGLTVVDRRDHPEDLLEMRDRVRAAVDYETLLGAMGERGERLLDGVHDLEEAVEDRRVGYLSLVAEA